MHEAWPADEAAPHIHLASRFTAGLMERWRIWKETKALTQDLIHITGDIHFTAIRLSDRPVVLTIHDLGMLDEGDALKRWLKKNPTPWPSIAQGPLGEINTDYAVNSWPTHVLIDSQGRLIAYGRWGVIKEAVINQIWEPKDNTNTE